MRLGIRLLSVAALTAFLSAASMASAQQMPSWPDRWLAAGLDFGKLKVRYRLTDECEIDPDFEITESPNLDVTREEILESMQDFLAVGTWDAIPPDVIAQVAGEVLGQASPDPDRPISVDEGRALQARFDELGPWLKVRMAPVGQTTYRCTFDTSGALIRVQQSPMGEAEFTEFSGRLSELGPFYLSWRIEE